MFNHPSLSLAVIAGLAVGAHAVNLRGKVTNQSGKAIANASLTLAPDGLKGTSGSDGSYSIVSNSISFSPALASGARGVYVKNGTLEISMDKAMPVTVEIFDTKGTRLHSESFQNSSVGVDRLDLGRIGKGTWMLLIKVSMDQSVTTFNYVQMQGQSTLSSSVGTLTQVGGSSARLAAVPETLKVTATGFTANSIALASLDTTINITLDSADRWGGLNNPPIKSAGCGKALGTISASGTYHIASAGGRGDYIIDIPPGYNKDNPYRLVFANHCMGGSAARMAAVDTKGVEMGEDLSGFYSIKTMATIDNIQNIYVALQGNGDGTWNPSTDPQFFADVLALVEGNLCVDTTRVFVAGFSFGAMFSYSLSLGYPEKIRAVACYAPANWNFDPEPTNRHIPIAYYQTTGINDDRCPWINNDAQKQGGKYCLLQHAQDNGCNTSAEIKLATGGSSHVVTQFAGCKDGYPVKFGSHNGGHQAESAYPGSNKNWIQDETWKFFKQF